MAEEETKTQGNPKQFFAGALIGAVGGVFGSAYFSLNNVFEALIVILTAAFVIGMLAWTWGGDIWEIMVDMISDD
jgi:hypothetical protein